MSDFQALGGVSASLKALLRDRMEVPAALPGGTFLITVAPPPTPPENGNGGTTEDPRVNLFLYRVTRNGTLANQEIPGHGHPAAYGRPPLSLDLHYMLTTYGTSEQAGETDETVAHLLLGSAMHVFHDVPVVTEDLIDGDGVPVLHPSLHGEFERIKISLDPISLEDLAKVWTATTFPYRLSAAYTVSVVQIESRAPRRHPQLVLEPPDAGPGVLALAVVRPLISEVRVHRIGTPPSAESRFPYARIGDDLILLGSGLAGEATRVLIGDVDATAGVVEQRPDRLVVTVPNHPDLQPGPQTASLTVGASALRSNVAVFGLVPRVDAVATDLASVPRRFTITGARLWTPKLSGETLIAEEAVPKSVYLTAAGDQIVVPLPDTLPAWPVRALRSGPLPDPLAVADPEFQATIGGSGPADLELAPTPTDPVTAAEALQRALRGHSAGGPRFTGARAAAAGVRLWIVPGELAHAAECGGPAAESLRLTAAGGAAERRVYLSGELVPFPRTSADQPSLRVTIGGTIRPVTLAARPASLGEAATLLQDALRAGGGPADFAQAVVLAVGHQLCIAPGVDAAATVAFDAVPGVDETSVVELRLSLEHRVRVRVNGSEDVDQRREPLP